MDRQARIVAKEGKDMTQEDILRMAREAGFPITNHLSGRQDIAGQSVARFRRFAAIVAAAEREAISDEYAARLQGDLENGVRWLNEVAASEFHKKYPQLASFNAWLNERENT